MNTKSFSFILLTSLLSLCACSTKEKIESESPIEESSIIEEKMTFTLNDYPDALSFHSEDQIAYFNDDYSNIDKYATGNKTDLSKSVPITISWNVETNLEDPTYRFIYGTKEDLSDSFEIETKETHVDLSNLLLDQTYYYQIKSNGFYLDELFLSDVGTFKTSGFGLRNLNISSLSNFRDLGGLIIGEGKRIKQGLIYRSAAFNTSYTSNITVNDEDISILKDELDIKVEVDLRDDQETSKGIETGDISVSPLGDDVSYIKCPMLYGGMNILTRSENQESVKAFFNLLADKNNYPMVFHCSQGKDRTGGLAYVIGALLGVEHEWLMKDYLFTNFSDIGTVKASGIEGSAMIYGVINKFEGETLKEKTYNYLVNRTGIESATLDKIIEILGE